MNATPDNRLADPEQIIADLERQLAESKAERDVSKAERDEALQRETATAEVLQVINSSPGNLTPVFEAMLEKAIRLCGGDRGVLWTIEGGRGRLAAARGLPAEFVALLRERGESGTNSPLQRVVQGEWLIEFPDTVEEFSRSGDPHAKGAVEAGVRSAIWVAIVKEGVTVGAFAIGRSVIGTFSDKQIALLQNFAAQAVIAMENARLLTETREALEQQTATAEVLQVINASPGDLTPVFEAILEKAHALCGADHGALAIYDGERFRAVALHAIPEQFKTFLRQPYPPYAGGAQERLLRGAPLVHIPDILVRPPITPIHHAAKEAGIRTLLMVPLRKDDHLLGYITANRREVSPFTNKQIVLLQNFAAQAVIAMENARLITATREALEQQTATAEVLAVINSSPGDLAPVFDAMLEKATRLCEAPFGNLRTWDGERFHFGAVYGDPQFSDWVRRRDPLLPDRDDDSPLGQILKGEQVVRFTVAPGDESRWTSAGFKEMVEISGMRSGITVALNKDGALLGTISVYRQEVRPFSDKQIGLLQNFAAQAVIAIENARLIAETREALEQQTATAEVLGVINSSPGDLVPVFDAILEKAHALCGAATGSLQLYDGEFFRAVATRGLPDEFANILRQPHRSGLRDALLRDAPFVQITDIADPALTGGDKTLAVAHDIAGVRTYLRLPLRKDDALLGLIVAGRREVRPFSQKEISLLQSFAAQAVIAMENARLLGELRQRTDEVAELNRGLEARVAEQVEELGRVGRLKRFLAPQLAELIVSQGNEKILESHRREIVVVFCDLRGYTAFTETAEPEEVLDFLRDYHGTLGPLVAQFEGTLDQFSGDGIMVFFNDPVPIPDPAARAVNMAVAMRGAAATLIADWRERGRDLGFGVGIAQGYATLGQIGFSERSGYTAIGTVCNVAARLCAEARDGQILLSQRINAALRGSVVTEQVGALALKGLAQPVVAHNVPLAGSQAAFRVIEGGPPSA